LVLYQNKSIKIFGAANEFKKGDKIIIILPDIGERDISPDLFGA